jgi:hypothetical protein
MTGLVVDVLGTSVELQAPASVLAEVEALARDLAPGRQPARQVRLESHDGGQRLVVAELVVLDDVHPSHAAATLLWRLSVIAGESTTHLVLHAAAVAEGDDVVLLPGASGTGKSTLAAAAVEAGLDYLTDEHAAVSLVTGGVVPFARPIDLGAGGLVPASSLRTGSVSAGGRVAAVVFPRFDGTAPTDAAPLPPVDALLALCAHATNLRRVGGEGFVQLARIVTDAQVLRVTYGRTDEALGVVRQVLTAARHVVDYHLVVAADETTTVQLGDDLVVLDHVSGLVHALNPAAAYVWLRVAADGSPVEDVKRDDGGGRLALGEVDATLDRLVELGLVRDVAR